MTIYWVALLFTIILSQVLTNERVKLGRFGCGKITHLRVFISFLPLFLVALLRWNVGVDVVYGTGYYYNAYEAISNSLGNIYNYELGFYWLMKIFNYFDLGIYLFYSFITVVFFIFITKFISGNSKNIAFSAIIFVLSDLYLFSFSTLRQTLSIALALYPISKIINNNFEFKNFSLWIFIILSLLMHNTIIYLYILLLFSRINFSKKNLIFITVVGIVLNPFLHTTALKIIKNLSYFDKYYGSNMLISEFSLTYFLISLLLLLIALANYKKLLADNKNNYFLINFCALTTIIMTYSNILIMPYRIFPLFVPFYIILCSKIVELYPPKTYKKIFAYVYLLIPFLFLFVNQYYFRNGDKNFKYHNIFEYSEQVFNK